MAHTTAGTTPRLRTPRRSHRPEEWTINAVHRLRVQLKQMTDLTKKRSHRTELERATSTSKGNDSYAAMEAVIKARAQQEEAKWVYDAKFAEAVIAEEAHHDAISRTLEKTEILERHVKTVTMRADSLTFVEADFFQTLIEREEETIRELNFLYSHLCLRLSPVNVDPILGSSLS